MELLLIFLSTGVISYVSAFFLSKYPWMFGNGGLAVCAGVFWGTVSVAFMRPFPLSFYGAAPLLVGSVSLASFSVKESKCPLWALTIILCFAVSLFFMPEYLVFQGALPFWADRAITSLFWASFILMFYRFAEETNFGVVQAQAISLAFLVLGFITQYIVFNNLMFYDTCFCGSMLGYLFMKRRFPTMELGRVGALFIGFYLGGFFFICALMGKWIPFVVMPMFLFLDYLYAGVQEIRAHLTKKTYTLFYFLPKFVILSSSGFSPFFMKRMLMIALLGVLLQTVELSDKTLVVMAFFSVAVIVVDTVIRIENWGKPKPKIRDLVKDIREAGKEVHSQFKKGMKELKDR